MYNFYKTRSEDNWGNLNLNKPNTTLIQNYYTSRGIRLFNQILNFLGIFLNLN